MSEDKPKPEKGGRPGGPKSRASRRALERSRRRRRRLALQVAAAAVAVVALAALIGPPAPLPSAVNTALSQHFQLDLFINGSQLVLAAHIGVNKTLWKDHSLDSYSANKSQAAIHTHNTTGSVHVELRAWHPCHLGEFFSIWGASFDSTHLLGYVGTVTVTVNGKPNSEFRNLLLQEGQNITIRAG